MKENILLCLKLPSRSYPGSSKLPIFKLKSTYEQFRLASLHNIKKTAITQYESTLSTMTAKYTAIYILLICLM